MKIPVDQVTPALLLSRLDAIAASLRDRGCAQALIGLGAVGRETDRLDARSDLDFFVIAEAGLKSRLIESLDWLAAVHPLAWHFRNTVDGHKALMRDGVFCEFAVFEREELDSIPFAPGRVVWRRDGVDPAIGLPRRAMPPARSGDESWLVDEALSCLFVGLQRWHRGERLSGARFVQAHALDRLIELDALKQPPAANGPSADPFNIDRRLEFRQPSLAAELSNLMPGYAATPQAALAVLAALMRRSTALDNGMAQCVRDLAHAAMA
jgi:hypothetical protein